ncbi:TPA: hypothetical protein SAP42_006989 [Burkholderia multivorans]|nr:hypothetical protein [Burkholderia multivorans]HEF4774961.1 hypothetical protein [Burkholderia multivorans]
MRRNKSLLKSALLVICDNSRYKYGEGVEMHIQYQTSIRRVANIRCIGAGEPGYAGDSNRGVNAGPIRKANGIHDGPDFFLSP